MHDQVHEVRAIECLYCLAAGFVAGISVLDCQLFGALDNFVARSSEGC